MNRYIQAIKELDVDRVQQFLKEGSIWREWSEPTGKNALHYLCEIPNLNKTESAEISLKVLKLLLKYGMDINSVHLIQDKNCGFTATPLWYAYTRGRNEKLYKSLLKQGANPDNCWWAMSWYDDVDAGKLWLKHGAKIDKIDQLFVGTFGWKRYRFAKWLLGLGADVNAADEKGNIALMIAVKRKDEDAIGFLLDHGADPDRRNKDGISARNIAESKGPKRLLVLLNDK